MIGGEANDLGDFCRLQTLEIQQQYLPIDGLEPLDQCTEGLEHPLGIGKVLCATR